MKFELSTLEEYSDEALLSELRRVAENLHGQRLTRERFEAMARVGTTTLRRHFGSWRGALDRAGISDTVAPRQKKFARKEIVGAIREYLATNPESFSVTQATIASYLGISRGKMTARFGKWKALLAEAELQPVPLARRYTGEECFENLLLLWTHYGRQPRRDELRHPPSTVGLKAYVRRWGSWRAALDAFVKRVNEEIPPATAVSRDEARAKTDPAPSLGAPAPRSISLGLRYRILSRDRFRCVICGASPAKDVRVELHIDHIIPWSRGGKNVQDNLRILCSKCNLGKGARMEESAPET